MTPAPSRAAEAPPVGERPAVRRWAVLAVVLVGESLDLLNAAITAIAAPGIARDLGGGAALVQWPGASYPAMIVVARLVQGVFGALLLPQGFGLLGAVFPREQLSSWPTTRARPP